MQEGQVSVLAVNRSTTMTARFHETNHPASRPEVEAQVELRENEGDDMSKVTLMPETAKTPRDRASKRRWQEQLRGKPLRRG